jgi:hypothetical protein
MAMLKSAECWFASYCAKGKWESHKYKSSGRERECGSGCWKPADLW